MQPHTIVPRDQWVAARKVFLETEKRFTKARDELSRQRRELPWVKVDKRYLFDGPSGQETLAELFGGKSQLLVYHFMFGPDWEQGCPSCSFLSDHFDGAIAHLAQRDVILLAVSRAPLPQIEAFKKRMGWRFKWVSPNGCDFNRDYHVSFTKDELEQSAIFHTYTAYARGLDILVGTYNLLDLVPKGRDEAALPRAMAWVRHHDRYEDQPKQLESCCA
jgi:predicted dithiol-disulfide oxidoreductase (DUF899 family)